MASVTIWIPCLPGTGEPDAARLNGAPSLDTQAHRKLTLIQQAEADHSVSVLVFKSADPDYFISHVDLTRIKELREEAAKLDEKSVGLLSTT